MTSSLRAYQNFSEQLNHMRERRIRERRQLPRDTKDRRQHHDPLWYLKLNCSEKSN